VTLRRLDFCGVRNLHSQSLRELTGVNIFYGANGSGKTSLLEAVHLLGLARSFRTGQTKSVITHGFDACTVFGEILRPDESVLAVGVSRTRDSGLDAKIGGERVQTRADLAQLLPLQVIHADSFNILTGAPLERRQFMDWGVFHVEHRFFETWQRFQKSIKQRNSLLRRGNIDASMLRPWDEQLAAAGELIDTARAEYVETLSPIFSEILKQLSTRLSAVELRYRRGWEKGKSLGDALAQSEAADIQQGFTHVGPQRADIRVLADGKLAADSLSRGQLKLVVCALKLAQGRLLALSGGRACTYLIDDLTAELDLAHSVQVAALLEEMDAQLFVTCIEQSDAEAIWPATAGGDPCAMFHVEHGKIERQ
jgi:DNA replication and repair protein RecF